LAHPVLIRLPLLAAGIAAIVHPITHLVAIVIPVVVAVVVAIIININVHVSMTPVAVVMPGRTPEHAPGEADSE
jgi:hypothetical protein